MQRLTIFVAGLVGAAGVALAAAGAHLAPGGNLTIASTMLMIHAAALLALAGRPLPWGALQRIALVALLVALLLFCGDLSLRAMADTRLFPGAAPIGGSLLIVAWLTIAASAFGTNGRE